MAVTAWNHNRDRETYVEYLEKSLKQDSHYVPTLMSLGTHLQGRDDERSRKLIERAFSTLQEQRKHGPLSDDRLRALQQAAAILDRDEVANEAQAELDKRASASDTTRGEYDADRLAVRHTPNALSS